jgi:hypothetical protein
MMDKSSLDIKYWGSGRELYIGDEDEIVFSTPQDMHKAIEAIELLDELNGGIRHGISY